MTDKAESQELVRESNKSVFETPDLASVDSFDNALALLKESGIVAESIDDYGTGFDVCEDKDLLVKRPFVILEWRFNESDLNADGFVSATAVTKQGEKIIINDGSSGICRQLREITASRIKKGQGFPQQGLACPKGLRKSEYMYVDKDGEKRPATTYYLA